MVKIDHSMNIYLSSEYYNDSPVAVLSKNYNLILWFKVNDIVIAVDVIYDNHPPYVLAILTWEEAKKRYKELIDSGWKPIVELEENDEV